MTATQALLVLVAFAFQVYACPALGGSGLNMITSLTSNYPTASSSIWWTDNSYRTCVTNGQQLPPCFRITSPNGYNSLILQGDKNAVVYKLYYSLGCNNNNGCITNTWSANTWSSSNPTVGIRVSNGNFQVTTSGGAAWDAGVTTANMLCVQDDGNLVVYDSAGNHIWSYYAIA
ncbi:hypothetical protein HDU98_003475 [Podochytrium sp. JEL0797]|nr:hypothetical protein HDU98_003475 [Podochytrium sp. JEL0797]